MNRNTQISILFSLVLILFAGAFGAKAQAENSPAAATKKDHKVTFGLEVDVVPYFLGGFQASAWIGLKHINQRIRPVVSKTGLPAFTYGDQFVRNTVWNYALMTDIYLRPGFEKLWFTTGIAFWDAEVENRLGQTGIYNNWMFKLGFGYTWKFYQNFYLNGSVAGVVRIAGDESIKVGEDTFEPWLVMPDVSVRIGWFF